ncbi:MAG: metalloregulator ArsR/SmtB family transcription factor [Candidatus Eisenbacteria bacterium]
MKGASTPRPAAFTEAAAFLKALGHPVRLRILCGLAREPRSLSRIAEALELPLSSIALHLSVLRRRGLLAEERRGAEILFRVRDERAIAVLDVLCAEESKRVTRGRDARTSWDWPSAASERATAARPSRPRSTGRK